MALAEQRAGQSIQRAEAKTALEAFTALRIRKNSFT
jgi:hypothetical protein